MNLLLNSRNCVINVLKRKVFHTYPRVLLHGETDENESKAPASVEMTSPMPFESLSFPNLNNLKGYSKKNFYNYIMYMAACLPNYVRSVEMKNGILELDVDPKGKFLVMDFMDQFQNNCILMNPSEVEVECMQEPFNNVKDPFIDDYAKMYTQEHSWNFDDQIEDDEDINDDN